jgi:acyl dehydratase
MTPSGHEGALPEMTETDTPEPQTAAPGPVDVAVGDEVPAFVRDGTAAHWTRFAAVNDEFAPHHWNVEVARHEGFDGPFAMAPLELAFYHAMLRDWMGDSGRIESVAARLRAPFIEGRTLTSTARVTAVAVVDGRTRVDLELAQTDDEGRTISTGEATVELPR